MGLRMTTTPRQLAVSFHLILMDFKKMAPALTMVIYVQKYQPHIFKDEEAIVKMISSLHYFGGSSVAGNLR